MWCPEGYATLWEARNATLQVARDLIYPQYGNADDIYTLLDGTLPSGAKDFAWAMGEWLFEDLLRRNGWGVSTPEGKYVRLRVDRLLEVGDFRGVPFNPYQSYNPITTIGPPSPKWLSFYDHSFAERFLLVDFRRGIVRSVVPWTYWKSCLLRTAFRFLPGKISPHHIGRALAWGQPFSIARKFRGQAICLKASDLEQWDREIREYLAAFMELPRSVNTLGSVATDVQGPKAKGRKPTTRREVSKALLELLGPAPEPITGWKETARRVEEMINKSVSESTLRRAFQELKER